jgi:hypothetical protein
MTAAFMGKAPLRAAARPLEFVSGKGETGLLGRTNDTSEDETLSGSA